MIQAVKMFLDDFSKQVKGKKYKKISYTLWRELVQKEGKVASVSIEYSLSTCAKSGIKMIYFDVDGDRKYLFETDDGSFGQYLWDWYKNQHSAALKSATDKMKESFAKVAETAKSTSADFTITSEELAATASLNKAWDNAIAYDVPQMTTATSWRDAIGYDENSSGWGVYDNGPATVEVNSDYFKVNGQTIEEMVEELVNKYNKKEEKEDMNLFKNFDFGSCESDNVRVSMYGIAVKNANGTWVSYDQKTGNIIDVDILNFDGKYLYKMPVAIKDIKAGDTIIHGRKPMFVSDASDGKLLVIDPAAGEEKIVLPVKNMFGFDFVTRVVNLFENFTGGATADQPFGNMLPLMLMNDSKSDDVLPLMFMMNGGNLDMSNPMMMFLLMNGKNDNSLLPLMFLMNQPKTQDN